MAGKHIVLRRSSPSCNRRKSGRKEASRENQMGNTGQNQEWQLVPICKEESHGKETLRIDLPMGRTHTHSDKQLQATERHHQDISLTIRVKAGGILGFNSFGIPGIETNRICQPQF